MPVLVCPSNDKDNPFKLSSLGSFGMPTIYGATDYVLSKGSTDAWCVTVHDLPRHRRGVFYVNLATRIAEIEDGTSKTMLELLPYLLRDAARITLARAVPGKLDQVF